MNCVEIPEQRIVITTLFLRILQARRAEPTSLRVVAEMVVQTLRLRPPVLSTSLRVAMEAVLTNDEDATDMKIVWTDLTKSSVVRNVGVLFTYLVAKFCRSHPQLGAKYV